MTERLGPDPVPGPDDAPYWEALRRGELALQRCAACGVARHPPRPRCSCGSPEFRFEPVSGRGRVHSFTVVHHPPNPALVSAVPYLVALIELDEGPRLVSNVVGMQPEAARIGQRVRVRFDQVSPGCVLPRFIPEESPA